MKTIFNYSFLIVLVCCFISCGGDDDEGSSQNVDCSSSIAVNQAIADEVNAISTVSQAYFTDPSPANCDALRDAYQNYIDALRDLQGCANTAGVGAEFQTSLDDAEANISDLSC